MARRSLLATRNLVLSALMAALLMVGKQMMSGLPNIEPVSFLIILFTLELPRQTPLAIGCFILLQGVLYGFGIWWFMYLYIWYILMAVVLLFRRIDHPLFWAVVAGLYGLAFGGLCALVYFPIWDMQAVLVWWLAGLQFDLYHMVGNFVITLLLYRPLRRCLALVSRHTRPL